MDSHEAVSGFYVKKIGWMILNLDSKTSVGPPKNVAVWSDRPSCWCQDNYLSALSLSPLSIFLLISCPFLSCPVDPVPSCPLLSPVSQLAN